MEVASFSVETDEWTIPDQQVWRVRCFKASAAFLDGTTVSLVWDYGAAGAEILRASHGEADFRFEREVTGDGAKKLAIVLDNNTNGAHAMGGFLEAKRVS